MRVFAIRGCSSTITEKINDFEKKLVRKGGELKHVDMNRFHNDNIIAILYYIEGEVTTKKKKSEATIQESNE